MLCPNDHSRRQIWRTNSQKRRFPIFAGLPAAHTLLVAARVLRAFVYARDPGYDLADVACKMGYSDPCILTRHIRAAMGEAPSVWRRTATSESVLLRLRGLLLPDVPGADVDGSDPQGASSIAAS